MPLAVKNTDINIILHTGGKQAGCKILLVFTIYTCNKNGDPFPGHQAVSSLLHDETHSFWLLYHF